MAVLLISLVLLLLCVCASLAIGSRTVGFQQLVDGLFRAEIVSLETNIVRKRISRTVFSLLCGSALGVSGALMQAVTRNPIADPGILGVNTGASLFVVFGIAFLHIEAAQEYIWLSLAGSALTAVFVYGIGSMGRGGATPLKLALAGAATSAALSSLVSTIMIPRSRVMDQFRFWQVGSVGAATWDGITAFGPFILFGILIGFLSAPALNAMALGDETARGLGVRVGIVRAVAAFASVLLCGAVTALAGPIGFIGLLAPHIVRLPLGADQRFTIPMSAIAGGIILTAADIAGRVMVRPGELEAGVVTAFIGAPLLITLAKVSKVRSL
ncbi:MAG: iron ABC transporter permease [Treponema sp.]|nr:iron ABC transporter permease [Treponema sp.]